MAHLSINEHRCTSYQVSGGNSAVGIETYLHWPEVVEDESVPVDDHPPISVRHVQMYGYPEKSWEGYRSPTPNTMVVMAELTTKK